MRETCVPKSKWTKQQWKYEEREDKRKREKDRENITVKFYFA